MIDNLHKKSVTKYATTSHSNWRTPASKSKTKTHKVKYISGPKSAKKKKKKTPSKKGSVSKDMFYHQNTQDPYIKALEDEAAQDVTAKYRNTDMMNGDDLDALDNERRGMLGEKLDDYMDILKSGVTKAQ